MDLSLLSPRGRFLKHLGPQMARIGRPIVVEINHIHRIIDLSLRCGLLPGRIFSNPLNRIALPLPKAALLTGRDLAGLLLLPIATLLVGHHCGLAPLLALAAVLAPKGVPLLAQSISFPSHAQVLLSPL